VPGLEHFYRTESIPRTHGVIVPNRDDRQIETFLTDQAHIAKQTGIPRQVDFVPIQGGQQEPNGVSAIGSIRQGGTMQSKRQLEVTKGMLVSAAQVLTMGFYIFGSQPVAYFKITDDRCSRPTGNIHGIANMIPVSVRNEDVIRRNAGSRGAGSWISIEERVHQDMVTSSFHSKRGMTVPGECCRHSQSSFVPGNLYIRLSVWGG